MVTWGEIPGERWTTISTFSAVLSSTFLILILPFSFALIIESIRFPELIEKGTSLISNVFLFNVSILDRSLIFPPRFPLL